MEHDNTASTAQNNNSCYPPQPDILHQPRHHPSHEHGNSAQQLPGHLEQAHLAIDEDCTIIAPESAHTPANIPTMLTKPTASSSDTPLRDELVREALAPTIHHAKQATPVFVTEQTAVDSHHQQQSVLLPCPMDEASTLLSPSAVDSHYQQQSVLLPYSVDEASTLLSPLFHSYDVHFKNSPNALTGHCGKNSNFVDLDLDLVVHNNKNCNIYNSNDINDNGERSLAIDVPDLSSQWNFPLNSPEVVASGDTVRAATTITPAPSAAVDHNMSLSFHPHQQMVVPVHRMTEADKTPACFDTTIPSADLSSPPLATQRQSIVCTASREQTNVDNDVHVHRNANGNHGAVLSQIIPRRMSPIPNLDSSSRRRLAQVSFSLEGTTGRYANQHHQVPKSSQRPGFAVESNRLPGAIADATARRMELLGLLSRVFSMFYSYPERYWAREFLFDPNPVSTLQILTNQAAQQYIASCCTYETCFEISGTRNGMFDMSLVFDGIFVPAYSADGLTIGAMVSRICPASALETTCSGPIPSSSSEQQAIDHRVLNEHPAFSWSVGRFVRDNTSNTVLVVKLSLPNDEPAKVQTKVSFIELVSTRLRRRVSVVFNSDRADIATIVDSVSWWCSVTESRFCGMCGSAPNVACGCKLRAYNPRHPLDFSELAPSLEVAAGKFIGSAHATVVVADMGRAGSPRGIRHGLSIPTDSDRSHNSLRQVTYISAMLRTAMRIECVHNGYDGSIHAFLVRALLEVGVRICRSAEGASAARQLEGMQAVTNESCIKTGKDRSTPSLPDDQVKAKTALPTESAPGVSSDDEDMSIRLRRRRPKNITEADVDPQELRRIVRNRETAARSNAKKKAMLDALKSNLARMQATERELKRTETQLRQENESLKDKLSLK